MVIPFPFPFPIHWRTCPTCGRECLVNDRALAPHDGKVALRVVMKCKVCHTSTTYHGGIE